MILGILGWIVCGFIVGFTTSKIIDLHGDDPRLGTAAACGGALLAGVIYTIVSGAGVSAWNVWSLVYAAVGAIVSLVVWHAVRARFVSRAPYTRRSSY